MYLWNVRIMTVMTSRVQRSLATFGVVVVWCVTSAGLILAFEHFDVSDWMKDLLYYSYATCLVIIVSRLMAAHSGDACYTRIKQGRPEITSSIPSAGDTTIVPRPSRSRQSEGRGLEEE